MKRLWLLVAMLVLSFLLVGKEPGRDEHRSPREETELKYWLGNMIWHHGFSDAEVSAATGLRLEQVAEAKGRYGITSATKPPRSADAPLLVLPYPGGRHPRIGFLDGAVDPQRETKVSVFTPWDESSYVVLDVPEAIWSNLGLTYLAHTHVPTIWEKQSVELERLEWNRRQDGSYDIERTLPNGIVFATKVVPRKDHVWLEMTLDNGTKQTLSDLRVQNCAMLKGAKGFEGQTNENKLFEAPYAAVKNEKGDRWIVFAWQPCHRPWGNEKCPCLHSDPKFPDCEPGQTRKLVGRLSFYEGTEIEGELRRIEETGWWK